MNQAKAAGPKAAALNQVRKGSKPVVGESVKRAREVLDTCDLDTRNESLVQAAKNVYYENNRVKTRSVSYILGLADQPVATLKPTEVLLARALAKYSRVVRNIVGTCKQSTSMSKKLVEESVVTCSVTDWGLLKKTLDAMIEKVTLPTTASQLVVAILEAQKKNYDAVRKGHLEIMMLRAFVKGVILGKGAQKGTLEAQLLWLQACRSLPATLSRYYHQILKSNDGIKHAYETACQSEPVGSSLKKLLMHEEVKNFVEAHAKLKDQARFLNALPDLATFVVGQDIKKQIVSDGGDHFLEKLVDRMLVVMDYNPADIAKLYSLHCQSVWLHILNELGVESSDACWNGLGAVLGLQLTLTSPFPAVELGLASKGLPGYPSTFRFTNKIAAAILFEKQQYWENVEKLIVCWSEGQVPGQEAYWTRMKKDGSTKYGQLADLICLLYNEAHGANPEWNAVCQIVVELQSNLEYKAENAEGNEEENAVAAADIIADTKFEKKMKEVSAAFCGFLAKEKLLQIRAFLVAGDVHAAGALLGDLEADSRYGVAPDVLGNIATEVVEAEQALNLQAQNGMVIQNIEQEEVIVIVNEALPEYLNHQQGHPQQGMEALVHQVPDNADEEMPDAEQEDGQESEQDDEQEQEQQL